MKKLLIFSFLFPFSFSFAQNLVPNPSFEDTIACPNFFGQTNLALGWNINISTADYFNRCATYGNISVPSNGFGFQNPPNVNCNAYCGLYTYIENLNYREYIGTQLSSALIIGQKYYVSLKVNLPNSTNCATNKIGIRCSTGIYSDTASATIFNHAHVFTSTKITDTANWTLITGSFIADSAYKYLMVGNFFDNSNTDTVKFNNFNCTSYYFVDDICLSTDSLACYQYSYSCITGIEEQNVKFSVTVFPSPFLDFTTVSISPSSQDINYNSYSICNIYGRELKRENITEKAFTIHRDNLQAGVYLLKIYWGKKHVTKKIIITN